MSKASVMLRPLLQRVGAIFGRRYKKLDMSFWISGAWSAAVAPSCKQKGNGMSIATPKSNKPRLTRNQIRGFWAAWGGWALDGMDSFIYAMVLVPALRELLPRS